MNFIKIFDFFKEINCLLAYYFMAPQKKQIVFYAEDKASYGYFKGVIDELTTTYNYHICYFTSDKNDPLFGENEKRIHCFYIDALLPLFTSLCEAKFLIMTMPDLNLFQVKRSKFGVNHVYIFHNIGSSFPVIRHGALFHYDTIFCVGPHHKEEIRLQEKLYNLPQKELVEFGYYRLESVFFKYQQFIAKQDGVAREKKRILIGPSWGENSIFNTCGQELIQILLNEGYEVVARPHPMTNIHEPHIMKKLNKHFQGYPDYIYENDVSLLESLFKSDILITDWSGFMYEYAFGTERPVLFIDLPQKIVNLKYKEVGIDPIEINLRKKMGEIVHPGDLGCVKEKILKLLENKDSYKPDIIKARQKYVYHFGNSSKIGADYIADKLS